MAAGKYSAGTIFLQVVPVFRDTMREIQRESKRINDALADDAEQGGKEAGERRGKAQAEAMGREVVKGAKKSGEKAGEEYAGAFETRVKNAISSAQREVDKLNFSTASEKSIRDLERVQRKLKELKDTDFTADFNSKKLMADIALVEGALTALAKGDHDLKVTANLQKALDEVKAFGAYADKVVARRREMNFVAKADFKAAERQIGTFEKKFRSQMKRAANSLGDGLGPEIAKVRAKLEELADVEIGIDMDADAALAKARAIRAELISMSKKDIKFEAEVDALAAIAELGVIQKLANAIDGKDVDIKVDVNTGTAVAKLTALQALLAAFRGNTQGSGQAGDVAANSFRSFNAVLLALAIILPTLGPMLGALGGGLLALIPVLGAVAAGIGVLVLGFTGIGGAVTELGKVADEQKLASGKAAEGAKQVANATNAVADAKRGLADAERNAARAAADAARAVADARRNAAEAAEDAAERVVDARESAADAIKDALERQKDAQEEYRDAVQEVADAEQALRDARAKAEADAADLATRQRKNAVDERQAVLDLFQAQTDYNAVMADGAATDTEKEQASVNLEQAQIALNDTRTEQVALADEAADYAKNGVEGTEGVKSAQDDLTSALEAQKKAQEDVKKAAEDARDTQLEAAELISKALEDQNEVQAANARAIQDALRNQGRVAADSARAIADAKRNVARAQEGVADAVVAASAESTAAMDRLEIAMGKLSPAGQKFARFLFGLRSGFRETRDAVQEAMLPGIQAGLQEIIDVYGPKFKAFATEVGSVWGDLGRQMGEGLTSPAWQSFFETYGKLTPKITRDFGEAMGNWATGLAGIFETVAPYAKDLSEIMLDLSDRFAKFFQSKKGKSEVREFMEYAFRVGPIVVDFFKDMAKFATNLFKAMSPVGEAILDMFSGIFDYLAKMDPKDLQLILTLMTGLFIAFQVAVGIIALAAAGAVIFASMTAAIVFGVLAVIAILVALYHRFETVRDIVDKVISFMGRAIKWLWEKVYKPYIGLGIEMWKLWGRTIATIWRNVIKPALTAIWDAVTYLWKKIVKPYLKFIGDAFQLYFKAIKGYWNRWLWPVLSTFIQLIWELWKVTVKPVLKFIWERFQHFGSVVKAVWRDDIKPALENLRDFIDAEVKPKFETAVASIAAIWAGLKEAFSEPVRFMIEKVINEGIIDGFNSIARKVGGKEMSHVSVPEWATATTGDADQGARGGRAVGRADGGVLPGYTPGRDVHSFVSPTAGRLNLSGGEAIMRPEWTAAIGTQGVDYWNNIAKRGVGAVRNAMQGGQAFAKGGIYFPVRGGYVSRTPYNLGHDGMDINHPNDASGKVPYVSATDGVVSSVGYNRGYGNAVFVNSPFGELVYGHSYDGSVRVNPGDKVSAGQWLANIGNTGNSEGAHLHFGFPGGTFYGAEALLSGALTPGKIDGALAIAKGMFPGWAKNILKAPVEWLMDKASSQMTTLKGFGDNPYISMLSAVPLKVAGLLGDGLKNMIPGRDKFSAAGKFIGDKVGGAKDAVTGFAGDVADGLGGYKNGGVLPYNGTMKYDAGGYLPPGLTSVVNLTGKPEPVFTADQFDGMGRSGDGFTYAPTFQGSNLTSADVVDDLDFTRRKIRREGKYGRSMA